MKMNEERRARWGSILEGVMMGVRGASRVSRAAVKKSREIHLFWMR